jgi:hypothetical protein
MNVLVCRQSKSRRLMFYDANSLLLSNQQLIQVLAKHKKEFLIPKEGLEKSMAGKAVKISIKPV